MRCVTHQFAHFDSLLRAKRWLTQLGFRPDQIEVHTDGIPRIAVVVTEAQSAEVELLISAAELADPEGWPSFWDLARQPHDYSAVPEPAVLVSPDRDPQRSTPIHWGHTDKRSITFDSAPIRDSASITTRFT